MKASFADERARSRDEDAASRTDFLDGIRNSVATLLADAKDARMNIHADVQELRASVQSTLSAANKQRTEPSPTARAASAPTATPSSGSSGRPASSDAPPARLPKAALRFWQLRAGSGPIGVWQFLQRFLWRVLRPRIATGVRAEAGPGRPRVACFVRGLLPTWFRSKRTDPCRRTGARRCRL